MTDSREILRLAALVDAFNTAAETRMANDPALREKLKLAMTPHHQRELAERAEDLFDTAMEISMAGKDEDAEARMGKCTIAFVDALYGLIRKAGLADEFSSAFPAQEKTEDNAETFRDLGAYNLARLCAK